MGGRSTASDGGNTHAHSDTTPPPLPPHVQAGVTSPPPTVLPAAERLVAIGDLHGDLVKAQAAFRAAGLTDDRDRWVGGKAVCVQVRRRGTRSCQGKG